MTDFLQCLPAIIDTLAEQGWVVVDDFLSPEETDALRHEGELRAQAGEFHRAAVGRAEQQTVRDDIRSDTVRWLNPDAQRTAEKAYWVKIAVLQAALNSNLFLGIREGEFHYAQYPAGGFYQRHLDRFRDNDARVISCVCYLNQAWQEAEGGQLRLWLDAEGINDYQDIEPLGGRLVLFRSERFWHAVLPASRARWSVTGWLRRASSSF